MIFLHQLSVLDNIKVCAEPPDSRATFAGLLSCGIHFKCVIKFQLHVTKSHVRFLVFYSNLLFVCPLATCSVKSFGPGSVNVYVELLHCFGTYLS